MTQTLSMQDLETKVGEEIGVSDWHTLDQATINAFADCTGDHQWIHVDTERAQRESPFGGTIAHGMLTLSLLPKWVFDIPLVPDDVASTLNYGFDKVRFLTPAPAGARVRDRASLVAITPKRGGYLMTTEHTVEIESKDKPALIAEFLLMLITE